MEAVTLSESSLKRIRDAIPLASCHAEAAAGAAFTVGRDLGHRLDEVDHRIGTYAERFLDVTTRPRAVAARELYRRGRAAALAGWREEAAADFDGCLELDPYLAAAQLGRAYLTESGDAVIERLTLAVKYGLVVDGPVAARAALELATMLVERDRASDALELLNAVALRLDSVAVALAAARLAGDEAAQARLRERAPRYADRVEADRLGPVASRTFGQVLTDVLTRAGEAKVSLEGAEVPQPSDAYDIDLARRLVDRVRTLAAERWPTPAAEIRARLTDAQERRDAAQQQLDLHRSRPPVLKIVYERRRDELEALVATAEAERAEAQRELGEQEVEARERLELALERLTAGYDAPDDIGVAPLPGGVDGLPAEAAGLDPDGPRQVTRNSG